MARPHGWTIEYVAVFAVSAASTGLRTILRDSFEHGTDPFDRRAT